MKTKIIPILLIVIVFTLSACSSNSSPDNSNNFSNMITIDSQNLNTLVKLANTKLNNHDKVQKILSVLPGNETLEKFSVSTGTININYGLASSSDISQSDFDDYWTSKNNYRKIFANNATALFALVTDLEIVNFKLVSSDNTYTFSISKEQLQALYGTEINNLCKDSSSWKSNVIDKVINSDTAITKLFYVYPAKQEK